MYIPQFFVLEELLPKQVYFSLKMKDRLETAWVLLDDRMLWTADALRQRYGKMIVNTWKWGGMSQLRGWRPLDCKIGAECSQHKFGRALDVIFPDADVEEIRKEIIADPFQEPFMYITCIEKDVNWLHFDVRNWDKIRNGLLIVGP